MRIETFGGACRWRGRRRGSAFGGGAACALVEYANLLQVHLEGGVFAGRRVLSEAAVMEMRRDQLHGLPFTSPAQKREHGHGLTWWFDEADETRAAIVRSATMAFLDTYLRGDGGGLDAMNRGVFGPGQYEFARK